jgi:hypothetical protein
MKEFAIETLIAASTATVWAILIDGSRWTDWNTTVTKLEGTIAAGGKIKVFAKISPGRAFPVRVSEFSAPSRMVWTGGMPLGLFRGVRTFDLAPEGAGTRFSMREVFSGPLAPLITKSIPDLQPSFLEFAAALKSRAEAG